MKTKLITFILLLALLILPARNVYAQSPSGDVFRMGQSFTLKSGETLTGNIAVVGGNLTIEKDAIVNGDTVIVGGNLTMDGQVNGDVVVVGGNLTVSSTVNGGIVVVGGQVHLTKTAVVMGDISSMGGQVDKDPGAEVSGNIVNNAPPINIPEVNNVPSLPDAPTPPAADVSPFWQAAGVVGRSIAIALIGMLLVLFLHPQLEQVADKVMGQPLMAGGYGLLALIVTPFAIVVMAVTIIMIPVALLTVFILPIMWLFGMIALGHEVGERFTKAINQTWAPVLATGFGTFLLLLVSGLFGLIACIGWLVPFLLALLAIGGVVRTLLDSRFGRGKITAQPQVLDVPPAS